MANMLKLRLRKKINTSAFRFSLAIGSFIGFILNTYQWFVIGIDSFQWLSVVLGIGLLYEGGISEIIGRKHFRRYRMNISVPKIITLAIGTIVLVGGIMTLPYLIDVLTEKWIGAFGLVNIIAIFVIGAELFLID